MTALWTILALSSSMAGIIYLVQTDAKRRRAFQLGEVENRKWAWTARIALFIPFVLLIALGDYAALTIWMGAVTVAGWAYAAVSPPNAQRLTWWLELTKLRTLQRVADGYHTVQTQFSILSEGVSGLLPSRTARAEITSSDWQKIESQKVAELEARIAELEGMLRDKDESVASTKGDKAA